MPLFINYQYNGRWGNNRQAANAVFEADGETGVWEQRAEVDATTVSMCKYMAQLENVMLGFDAIVKVKMPAKWAHRVLPGQIRPGYYLSLHGTPNEIA